MTKINDINQESIVLSQRGIPGQGQRRPHDIIRGVVILIAGVVLLLALAQSFGLVDGRGVFYGVTAVSAGAMLVGLVVMGRVENHLRRRLDEAQALTNELYRQQRERSEQLATLNRVSALLTGSLSPAEVLDTIVSSASTVSDAQAVVVYLIASEAPLQAPRIARSAGLSDDLITLLTQPIMPSALQEDGLLAPPRALNDIREANLRPMLEAALLADGLLAVVELPMLIHQDELGTIALYYGQTQSFDEVQIDLLQAYTTQAAQAIANAYSYSLIDEALEKRVEQLSSLASLARVINASLDETKIYATVTQFAQEGTSSQRVALMSVDDEGRLKLRYRQGDIPHGWGTAAECDLIHQALVMRDYEVMRFGNISRVPAHDTVARKVLTAAYETLGNSLLIVPLKRGKQFEGILWLDSDGEDAHSDSDLQYITQIAYQAVIAMDNTHLFQRIRKNRDNLQTILNAMEEGILLIDERLTIAMANPHLSFLGLSYEALEHRSINEVMATHPELPERLGFGNVTLEQWLKHIEARTLEQAEAVHDYVLFDGTPHHVHVRRQFIPLQGDWGDMTGALFLFYNKTEEYELAHARDNFAQMIVHDLRSPLAAVTTSLRLISELVPEDVPSRPVIDKTLDGSRRAVRKVLNRVNALLDIAKMASGEMKLDREPTPIVPIVRNVISELNPLALELGISIEVEGEAGFLDIDAEKIERTLLNLVDNALKYNPMNTRIYVKLAEIELDGRMWAQIDVVDQGPGIPDEYKTSLFERFMQIDGRRASRHGVGLGLTFCKLVVDAHGGRIWIEDNEVGGSVFRMLLPMVTMPS